MEKMVRVPMAVASRMGVSALATKSAEGKVLLTSHGRPVAILGSAERFDEDARVIRQAAAAVLDAAADVVSGEGRLLNLQEVCTRLGVDVDRVRAKAAEKRAD